MRCCSRKDLSSCKSHRRLAGGQCIGNTNSACSFMNASRPWRHVCPSISSSRTRAMTQTCPFVAAANCSIRAFVVGRSASFMLPEVRTRTGEYNFWFPHGIGTARSCVSSFDSKAVRSIHQPHLTVTLELQRRRRGNKRPQSPPQ